MFVPSVEFIQEGAFLPDIPEKLWKNANSISVLTGICENEGGLFFKQNGKNIKKKKINRNPV